MRFLSVAGNGCRSWPIQKFRYDFQVDVYVDLELGAKDALMNVCAWAIRGSKFPEAKENCVGPLLAISGGTPGPVNVKDDQLKCWNDLGYAVTGY